MSVMLAPAAPAATTGPASASVRPAPDRRAPDAYAEVRRLMDARQTAAALARLDHLEPEQAREPRWRFLRAVLLEETGRAEEAASLYTALTQEYPDLPEPHNNLAVLRAGQGRLDEARVALEAALRADPAHRQARENLGDVYVRLAIRLWESLGPSRGTREPAAAAAAAADADADAEVARKLRLAREIGAAAR